MLSAEKSLMITTELEKKIKNNEFDPSSYVDKELKVRRKLTAEYLDYLDSHIHANFYDVSKYIYIIDNIPLTREEYNQARVFLTDCIKEYNSKSRDDYYVARNKIEKAFKSMLFHENYTFSGEHREEVFDMLYSYAKELSSAEYVSIQEAFNNLDDLIHDLKHII